MNKKPSLSFFLGFMEKASSVEPSIELDRKIAEFAKAPVSAISPNKSAASRTPIAIHALLAACALVSVLVLTFNKKDEASYRNGLPNKSASSEESSDNYYKQPTRKQAAKNWPSLQGPYGIGYSPCTIPTAVKKTNLFDVVGDKPHGKMKWGPMRKGEMETATGERSPLLEDGILYFTRTTVAGGEIYAIKANDMNTALWTATIEGGIEKPVVEKGIVYAVFLSAVTKGPITLTLQAVQKGKSRWSYELENCSFVDLVPIIHGNYIILGNSGGKLWVINKKTGVEVWRKTSGIRSTYYPAVTKQHVIIVDFVKMGDKYACEMKAFKLKTGELEWSREVGKFVNISGRSGAPLTDGKNVYYGSSDKTMIAVNAKTGKTVWKFKAKSPIGCLPSIHPDKKMLFFSSEAATSVGKHHMYAVDIVSGKEIWSLQLDGPYVLEESFVVTDNAVLVGAYTMTKGGLSDQLLALDIQTGDTIWKYGWEGVIGNHSAPAVSAKGIYVGEATDTGFIFLEEKK